MSQQHRLDGIAHLRKKSIKDPEPYPYAPNSRIVNYDEPIILENNYPEPNINQPEVVINNSKFDARSETSPGVKYSFLNIFLGFVLFVLFFFYVASESNSNTYIENELEPKIHRLVEENKKLKQNEDELLKKMIKLEEQLSLLINNKNSLSEDELKQQIITVTQEIKNLEKDDDRILKDIIGRVDYALGSAGAYVVSSNFSLDVGGNSWKSYLAYFIPSFDGDNLAGKIGGPKQILNPSLYPGNCWGFSGSVGSVTIALICPIAITHVTIDHAHLSTLNDPSSAPREFKVYGWQNYPKDKDQILLLESYFDINKGQFQTFELNKQTRNKIFKYVTLEIRSNHGSKTTCVYRFRVHSENGKCIK